MGLSTEKGLGPMSCTADILQMCHLPTVHRLNCQQLVAGSPRASYVMDTDFEKA